MIRSPSASSVSPTTIRCGPRWLAFHELLACGVQVGDVGSAQGDHHVAGRVAPRVLPPVGDQGGLRVVRVGRDDEPSGLDGVREVVEWVAVADGFEQVVLDRVDLSAVLAKLGGAEAFGDLGEEASRADAWQLVGVADQDGLAVGAVDHLEPWVRSLCERSWCGTRRDIGRLHSSGDKLRWRSSNRRRRCSSRTSWPPERARIRSGIEATGARMPWPSGSRRAERRRSS